MRLLNYRKQNSFKIYNIKEILELCGFGINDYFGRCIIFSEGDEYDEDNGNQIGEKVAKISIFDKANISKIASANFKSLGTGLYIFNPYWLDRAISYEEIDNVDILRYIKLQNLDDESDYLEELKDTIFSIQRYYRNYRECQNLYEQFTLKYGTPDYKCGLPKEEKPINFFTVFDSILEKKELIEEKKTIQDLQALGHIATSSIKRTPFLVSAKYHILRYLFSGNENEISFEDIVDIKLIHLSMGAFRIFTKSSSYNIIISLDNGIRDALNAIISAKNDKSWNSIDWKKFNPKNSSKCYFSIYDLIEYPFTSKPRMSETTFSVSYKTCVEFNEVEGYFRKGEELCKIGNIPVFAPNNGYYEFVVPRTFYKEYGNASFFLFKNSNVYNKDHEDIFASYRTFEYTIKTDRFTKAKTILWKNNNNFFSILRERIYDKVTISFHCINDELFIDIGYRTIDTLSLQRKSDEYFAEYEIILLLEDDSPYILNKRLYKATFFNKTSGFIGLEYYLEEKLLSILTQNAILAIRISSPDNTLEYETEPFFFDLFKRYATQFAKATGVCGSRLSNDFNKECANNPCFVYLMHDTTNGFYKIGISNNPTYRERTLQADKPTIELLIAKRFPIRAIAEAYESALHKTYVEKRIRGEWFDLSTQDVENLRIALT